MTSQESVDVTSKPDASKYTYQVRWNNESNKYIATVKEFPSLSFSATTQDSAMYGLRRTIKSKLAEINKNGEQAPVIMPEN